MMEIERMVGVAMTAAGLSFLISLVLVASQRWHGRHSFDHDLQGIQKFHTQPVPRIGGLALMSTLLLMAGGTFWLPELFPSTYFMRLILMLTASLPIFVAGITEDLTKQVSVKTRLTAAFASALLGSWLLDATVNELDIWGIDNLLTWTPAALMVTAIAVAGGANAINIIDGFNGLSAGVVAIMCGAFGWLGWQVGDEQILLLALLGGTVAFGFMGINYPRGRLFLGDGGAYFLGFWVAEIAVLLVRHPAINAWQVLSICAYPVIEVLYSIYRRKVVLKVSPGAPDDLHLHTLIYRRAASRPLRDNNVAPWKRNAAVAMMMLPCILLLAVLGIAFGDTLAGAVLIVLGQVLLYLAIYQRLLCGRWRWQVLAAAPVEANTNARLT